jgi:hypothetical protein
MPKFTVLRRFFFDTSHVLLLKLRHGQAAIHLNWLLTYFERGIPIP